MEGATPPLGDDRSDHVPDAMWYARRSLSLAPPARSRAVRKRVNCVTDCLENRRQAAYPAPRLQTGRCSRRKQ
eukprot:586885-Rhodomonas_salina.3